MADESCANPLLLSFLKEWLDQARERNSKGFTVYKKAYESMKACPLHFAHPKEAQQLHGLGPKLCDRLTDKLKAHNAANGLPMPELPGTGSKRKSDDEDEGVEGPVKRARKTKAYVPALRSGAYAIVLALATLDEEAGQGLPKIEVIELAQPHSDSSFIAPSDPTKFYTAWNSMKTLVSKDLVYEHGRPVRRYMLTEEGWEVAKRIKSAEDGSIQPNAKSSKVAAKSSGTTTGQEMQVSRKIPRFHVPDFDQDLGLDSSQELPKQRKQTSARFEPPDTGHMNVRNRDESSSTPLLFDPISLPAGSFNVQLILDSREVRTKSDRDYISSELQKRGITCLTRALPLGDALWIARVNTLNEKRLAELNAGDEDEGFNEIMLDHIVERKRLDDLIGSIKDGRFHEQKFRLRKSGIRNVTYIVEDFSISTDKGEKYGEAVESAISSMQVVNEYFVKRTSKLDDTIRYLERMTKTLKDKYEPNSLRVVPTRVLESRTYLPLLAHLRNTKPEEDHYITFSAFSAMCSKSETMTLRDVFLKMLMCTRGVTGEKAVEIQKKWTTPRAFIEAFEERENLKDRNTMVGDSLGSSIPRKRIAKSLSSKIAEVWA